MNRKSVFVDTGAWFAIADKSDQFHHHAKSHLKKIVENGDGITTSNLVIHETAMLLARRLSKHAAIQFLDLVAKDENVVVLQSDAAIEQDAYEVFRKYDEHDFSIVDCVSFVLMKNFEIKRTFTFDKHFKTMRFSAEP